MSSILVLESDTKLADKMLEGLRPIAEELKLELHRFTNLKDLNKNKNLKQLEPKLIVLKSEELGEITYDVLSAIRLKFSCELILTRFEDPENPIKVSHLWPIHNLIYKPFSIDFLKENVLQCLKKSDIVEPRFLKPKGEELQMEKIRKVVIHSLSDFGFLMSSNSVFKPGKAYKFYNPIFSEGKNRSIWARVISVHENIYELVYCAPKPYIIGNLRRRIAGTKNLQKQVKWQGLGETQVDLCKNVYIDISDKKVRPKLIDYFKRKFPDFNVIDELPDVSDGPAEADVLITEKAFSLEQIQSMFKEKPLYICVNTLFTNRLDAEERLNIETVRVDKNVDRHFLGRLINIYFPSIKDEDPDPIRWISCEDHTSQTEMQRIENLTSAGFEFRRDSPLEYGSYQEFAFANENEGQIKPIRCKILTREKADPNDSQAIRHQVYFYAVDESTREEIENHIQPPVQQIEEKAS